MCALFLLILCFSRLSLYLDTSRSIFPAIWFQLRHPAGGVQGGVVGGGGSSGSGSAVANMNGMTRWMRPRRPRPRTHAMSLGSADGWMGQRARVPDRRATTRRPRDVGARWPLTQRRRGVVKESCSKQHVVINRWTWVRVPFRLKRYLVPFRLKRYLVPLPSPAWLPGSSVAERRNIQGLLLLACSSGLRGATQVRMVAAAWVRIPLLASRGFFGPPRPKNR